jgi:cytochrome c biogenesis protein
MKNKIIDFAGSLHLAVILFTVTAVLSAVGTVFSPTMAKDAAVAKLSNIFGSNAESVYQLLEKTGITDIYYSIPFNAVLALLCVNLVVCSFQKLKPTWKLLCTPISADQEYFEKYKVSDIKTEINTQQAGRIFPFPWKRTSKESEGRTVHAFEKGRISRGGAIITHIGLVIIILGAFFSGIAGFNGNLAVLEGETSDAVYFRDGSEKKLPFQVHLNDFKSEYYDSTVTNSSFISDINIISPEGETQAVVEVNKPLKINGYTIYQSGKGFHLSDRIDFVMETKSQFSGVSETFRIKYGGEVAFPDSTITAKIADFAPALGVNEEGQLINFENSIDNPALLMTFFDGEKELGSEWILMKSAQSGEFNDIAVYFRELHGAEYSVLSIKKDPGILFVYLGFLIVSAGVFFAFYSRHHRAWLVVDGGATALYYTCSKGAYAKRRQADALAAKLSSLTDI